MLYEEGKEINGSGHSHGGDMSQEGVSILQNVIMSQEGVSILQHVIFSVHIIPSIQIHV